MRKFAPQSDSLAGTNCKDCNTDFSTPQKVTTLIGCGFGSCSSDDNSNTSATASEYSDSIQTKYQAYQSQTDEDFALIAESNLIDSYTIVSDSGFLSLDLTLEKATELGISQQEYRNIIDNYNSINKFFRDAISRGGTIDTAHIKRQQAYYDAIRSGKFDPNDHYTHPQIPTIGIR